MIKKVLFFTIFTIFFMASSAIAQEFNYKECMTRARNIGDNEVIKCNKAQTLIDAQIMQDIYNKLANDKEFNVLSESDLKRTYNAFIVYRNNYCKMYAVAHKEYYTPEFSEAKCLQELTRNAYLYMYSVNNAIYTDQD